ncbi:MAG: hypothetical protein JSS55_03605 [Proteobacteria bacterium]|nr:hypothetical protein [Pseudomonadota bacterium]
MSDLSKIERVLGIVEYCLCEAFPRDFFRRCAFAGFGVRALLQDMGIEAAMVGGQFAALVVAPDRGRLAVQGFKAGREPFPHFWVEADDRLIDLGPHLLAYGSDYPVLSMPALAWEMSAPLPSAIRYKAQQRLPHDTRMSIDQALNVRCDGFVRECRAVAANGKATPALPTWLASNYASLLTAVDRGDAWAGEAKRFENIAQNHPLPF